MADFASEVLAAQVAQREAWECSVRLDKALEARGLALARCWASRPGGTTWEDVERRFNDGLPPPARLRRSALRRDELTYRPLARREGG